MMGSILPAGDFLALVRQGKVLFWPYKKSFIIDPLVGQYCCILAKFLSFFFFVFMNPDEFIRSIKTKKET